MQFDSPPYNQAQESMTVVLGDSNAKSNNWCKADITSLEASMIDTIPSNYGLNQLIQEPTLILSSSSTCIDLIFTSQTKFGHGI